MKCINLYLNWRLCRQTQLFFLGTIADTIVDEGWWYTNCSCGKRVVHGESVFWIHERLFNNSLASKSIFSSSNISKSYT